ncbi:conjugative transposon protein TraM [Draconibacterium halophilum]|uniref:Conjugative transposon protein TraM n=1 Tax=Draconibacterium halophilum TaxID=2706887 RepID=A0A6C0RGK8_9BACT|nr:conjugative transposon protein TraM [Draconibacterium halophilum]QIA09126.1 conjugative transposon protein TraM [Draconibacterium halophilum]
MKKILIKNKALFILPLVLLPFLILIFWVLGGGGAKEEKEKLAQSPNKGINYDLPDADNSIEIYDKMEAYQKDDQQVAEVPEVNVNDTTQPKEVSLLDTIEQDNTLLDENADQKEILAHIRNKEKQLQQELQGEPEVRKNVKTTSIQHQNKLKEPIVKNQVKTTKSIGSTTPTTGIEELDEIIDQNMVLNRKNDSLKYTLQQAQGRLQQIEAIQNRSFTLEKKRSSGFNREEKTEHDLIKAEIYETATVLNGNRVKLRLLEDTRINALKMPRNTFIYGICKIKNERLLIEITQMPVQENFVPVKLAIYDLDGLEGLYVPDNAARKVYQEVSASTNTSSLMGVTNNPLTYTGIRAADRAAQTMLKRVRLKKVTVKKNTLVYIINQK